MFAHGLRTAGNFVRGFGARTLGRQRRQKSCVLGWGGFAVHNFVHNGVGFVVIEVLFIDDFLNCFANHFLSL